MDGAEEHRTGAAGSLTESAYRTERIDRATCRAVADYSFVTAAAMHGCVYGGPKWTVSPVYEGMLKEEMDAAAARDVVRVRPDGTREGLHPPSSEFPFHQAIYRRRPDLRAIVHAHPGALVAFSICRQLPDTHL